MGSFTVAQGEGSSSGAPLAAGPGTKTSGDPADKFGMTIANSSVEGIHNAQALLGYAANRIAGQTGPSASVYHSVSLSDTAITLIEAKIAMAANVSAFHAADEIQ